MCLTVKLTSIFVFTQIFKASSFWSLETSTQRLFYKQQGNPSSVIYDYAINNTDGIPVKVGEYNMPYEAVWPLLTYNYDLSVLEIVGELMQNDGPHNEHYQMTLNGEFNQYLDSLYVADKYSTIVYSDNVGTLCIGGYHKKQNVYIITQKSNWPTVTESNKNLDKIKKSPCYKSIVATSHLNDIYIVVGSANACGNIDEPGACAVQTINFDGVQSLEQAQSKSWTVLGHLDLNVGRVGLQFLQNQLVIIGSYSAPDDVQIFDLDSNTTAVYSYVINHGYNNSGIKDPVSYITDSNIYILGGKTVGQYCVEQTALIYDMDTQWHCIFDDNTGFEGVSNSTGFGSFMSFANAFV